MIPKILHSRSQLHRHFNEYDGGASSFFVSADTYPELFDLALPNVYGKAPKGWCQGKLKYLWFPPDVLDEDDLSAIDEWSERFEQYVLLGLNPNIENHFSDELDFCLALDFNYDHDAKRRTYYGEAEYQLKYQHSRQHFNALAAALVDALDDLPVPTLAAFITSVPADPGTRNVARQLAAKVATAKDLEYIRADLLCKKDEMKGLPVDEKVPAWEAIYSDPDCLSLEADVNGKTVIIIDDLYQSGATMWCFAKYLKKLGARHVLGLVCVKSLKDSDNQ